MGRLAFLAPIFVASLAACATPAATGLDTAGAPSTKPEETPALVQKAFPAFEAYLKHVLPGKTLNEEKVHEVKLVHAKPFTEGHVNEVWGLTIEVDGHLTDVVLKIFGTKALADANAEQFREAVAHDWPVPLEYHRGATTPYTERPSLLMEFITGGSLERRVKTGFKRDGTPDTIAIAAAYSELGTELGRLHKLNQRDRVGPDHTSAAALTDLLSRCEAAVWCGPEGKARLVAVAPVVDTGPVTFTHGDLYESQVIFRPDGRVAAFIDMDLAGFADPAKDVGSLLAHIAIFNPRVREDKWGVPNPSPEEVSASATGFLQTYRSAAGLEHAWPAFMKRVEAHMWLRVGEWIDKMQGNPHGRTTIEALNREKRSLFADDPLAKLSQADSP
jgi:aminoglycoside phosphotransferase (APT) family kinase protein